MFDLVSRSTIGYCERIGNSFFSEPFNFISNLAFLVSAFFVFRLYKKLKIKQISYWILFYLIILIAFGSFLWHSLRTPISHALDFIPIFLFLLLLFYLIIANLFGGKLKAVISVLVYLIIQIGMSYLFPQFLNGSIRHFNNIIIFGILGIIIFNRKKAVFKDYLVTILLYISAIIFRSLDNILCIQFPLGTHFLWHVLNGMVTYFAIKVLLRIKRVN